MLTEKECKALETKEKTYLRHDARGLYLEVPPNESKRWRLKYRVAGKTQQKSLGLYPHVSLREAREIRDELLRQLKITGSITTDKPTSASTFRDVADKWLAKERPSWSEKHFVTNKYRMAQYIYPHIGKLDIDKIDVQAVLLALESISGKGHYETAHRVRSMISRVFKYAIITGLAKTNPADVLVGALPTKPVEHLPAVTDPAKLGQLLRDMENLTGFVSVRYAGKIAPYVFVRPGELRQARWEEFNFEAGEWHIPAAKMKKRRPHIAPLSKQVIALLMELREHTGHCEYLFPQVRNEKRPMSDNTLNVALKRLGYNSEEVVPHGFRSTASTLLNQAGIRPDLIEKQLAHADKDQVRATYNRAEYLAERREMMQTWADTLDKLRDGAITI